MNIQIESFSSLFNDVSETEVELIDYLADPTATVEVKSVTEIKPTGETSFVPHWNTSALSGYEAMMRQRASACMAGR